MKKLLLTLILAFNLFKVSNSQTYVLIPDANFRVYLQSLIPTAFNGNSLNITNTLVTTSTQSLFVNNNLISNLDGVQYFTSLIYLNCSHNYLTTLPSLPNTLAHLVCNSNSLTSLPLLPTSLTTLRCHFNSLTSLPSLPNSLLKLICNSNSLTNLPSLTTNLFELVCNSNSLTSLPSLPNSLTILLCHDNLLTGLPELPNSLTDFACSNNFIKCFPLFPQSLLSVYLSPNPYNCLPNYALPAMNAYTTTPLCQAGNSNGCAVIGVRELSSNLEFISVFPNPAKNTLNLKITEGKVIDAYSIMDMLGRKLIEQKQNTTHINIEGLPKGIYQLVITSEGRSYTSKFIKE
jgi:hypothetical protein